MIVHPAVHTTRIESKVWSGICLNIYSLECTPLLIQCKINNVQDDFIVAILKSSIINGHVPQQIPGLFIEEPTHLSGSLITVNYM